jgi:hypothetical protein
MVLKYTENLHSRVFKNEYMYFFYENIPAGKPAAKVQGHNTK